MANLKVMDRELFNSIKTELVHCRKFLFDDHLRTFLAFIAMNYRIPNWRQPTQDDSLKLHEYVRQKAFNKIRHRLKTKYTRDNNEKLKKVKI